jgi:hypothetical protein
MTVSDFHVRKTVSGRPQEDNGLNEGDAES